MGNDQSGPHRSLSCGWVNIFKRQYIYWTDEQRTVFCRLLKRHIYVLMCNAPAAKKKTGWKTINKELKNQNIPVRDWQFLRNSQFKTLKNTALRGQHSHKLWPSDKLVLDILALVREEKATCDETP